VHQGSQLFTVSLLWGIVRCQILDLLHHNKNLANGGPVFLEELWISRIDEFRSRNSRPSAKRSYIGQSSLDSVGVRDCLLGKQETGYKNVNCRAAQEEQHDG
jgi:hypothetical protein